MRKHLRGGLQAQLAIIIPLVTLVLLAAAFFAIYRSTAANIENGIDDRLVSQQREFAREALPKVRKPSDLGPVARSFVLEQGREVQTALFAIELPDGDEVTNQAAILRRELRNEERSDRQAAQGAITNAPLGISTVDVPSVGPLRMLVTPITLEGETIGSFRVGLSDEPVFEAQESMRQTFLIVGILAVLASITLAIWIASLLTRPLREMAATAGAIGEGDLTKRVSVEGGGETRDLGLAFNRMMERLEAAFDRERAFVSDASHELRTPLTVLRGQIEVLQRTKASAAERKRSSELLLAEVDRMNSLVDDMLVLARAESGALLNVIEVEVTPFLEDLRRDLPLLGAKDAEVVGDPGGTLDADPARLEQVLRNLVRNAAKHGGDPITVDVEGDRDALRFSVADGGPGVTPDQLGHLFDRFYRSDSSRSRDEGGSGLGLAISRALVEAHGGSISATSPKGDGLTVSFEIPGWKPDSRPKGARRRERSSSQQRN